MNMVGLTEKNFDKAVEEHSLLVIDFWAEWCGPCKSFTKVLKGIAPKYPDFVFGSVNIDVEKELAEEFHVQSIPALMIIRDQVVVFAESGALSASVLGQLLDQTKTLDPKELE